jgi:putative tryptophan/tyrosine transport system substrate-binding protein
VKRREFITLLGGAAAAWPLAARGQQPAMPVVGILSSGSSSAFTDLLIAFRQGLKETGYAEGQNVAIESRWAEGRFVRLSDLAADLVHARAAVIVATGVSSALAAKAASSTIPLVFLSQDDPVKLGFVTNFNRPGGNATGMSLLTGALVAKRLEFIRQLVPAGTPIAYLMNPQAPESEFHLSYMQAAARDIGQQFIILNASSERDIDNAFAALLQERTGALIVSTDPFLFSRYHQIVVLAAYHKLPTIYDRREFVAAGDSSPTERTFPMRFAKSAYMSGSSYGNQAVRPPGHPADEIRAGDQPQDREGARSRSARSAARARRRGDRMSAVTFACAPTLPVAAWAV